jgi:hypothetical protein
MAMHEMLTHAERMGGPRAGERRGSLTRGETGLPVEIEFYLRRFVRRRGWVRVWRGVVLAVLFSAAWMGGWLLADRLIQLAWWVRLGALVVHVGVVGWLVGRPMWGMVRRLFDLQRGAYGLPRVDSTEASHPWAVERANVMSEAAAEVERLDGGFGDRLATVVSQVLGPGRHRGSESMLRALMEDVARRAKVEDPRKLLPWRRMLYPTEASHPWALFLHRWALKRWWFVGLMCALALGVAAMSLSWLDLPNLARRYVMPLTDVPPVTTTRLLAATEPASVDGVVDVVQGRPLTFRVEAARLGQKAVTLHLRKPGEGWAQVGMNDAGDGVFEHTLSAVEDDLQWFASGGDARTLLQEVRVLRRPAVAEFRIDYEYPEYSERRSLMVTNADGLIEAPVGTEAVVTVSATEPLERAVMRMGRDNRRPRSVNLEPTEDPRAWQGRLRVEQDLSYSVELVSDRGVPGSGPGVMHIRAIPDRPPLVRLLQPAEDLRLHPRDILQVHYQVLDDYGIGSMWVAVRVNDAEAPKSAVVLRGDARRQEGTHALDLAGLELQIGDVVTVSLGAEDRAGQQTVSEPRTVLISPRSIDINAHLRISELRQSTELVNGLVRELEAAVVAMEEGSGSSGLGYLFRMSQVDRYVTAAAETAVLLRQALLRAVVRSDSGELAVVLGHLVDEAQMQWSSCEQVVARLGRGGGMGQPLREQLPSLLRSARALQGDVRTILEAEQAAALLADRENVRASEQAHANDGQLAEPARPQSVTALLGETLRRAREEIATVASAMGMEVDDELEQNLREKVEAGQALLRGREALDFQPAAREWASGLAEGQWDRLLEERLSAAAQVEAVRPGGDLIYARDLQLGARAAGALAGRVMETGGGGHGSRPVRLEDEEERSAVEGARREYVEAMAALQRAARERRVADPEQRLAAASSGAAWDEGVMRAASEARARMLEWAGAVSGATHDRPGARRGVTEDLVLEAGAEAAGRGYERTEAIDAHLLAQFERAQADGDMGAAHAAEAIKEARRLMSEARELDRLAAEQGALARQTEAPEGAASDLLADRQQEVATAIQSIEEQRRQWNRPSAREAALGGIQQAQERLTVMPQQLAEAREAARVRRVAAARLEMAEMEMETAVGERYEVARRAAREALRQLNEAQEELESVSRAVHADVAESVARELRQFNPETSGAVAVLDQQLGPWLRRLRQAMRAGEGAEVEGAIQETREALDRVQAELRRAQDELVERDPLVAARWFAREATAALSHSPPNLQSAQEHQQVTTSALSRAWDQSVHRAATERLSGATRLRTLFSLPLLEEEGTEGAATVLETLPTLREWGRMRLRPAQPRTAPRHEWDPPGYQDALRAYFEALGRAGE